MGMWNLEHTKNATLLILRRQAGKTEILTRILAACILAFPNIDEPGRQMAYLSLAQAGARAKENLYRTLCYVEDMLECFPFERGMYRITKQRAIRQGQLVWLKITKLGLRSDDRYVEAKDCGTALRGGTKPVAIVDEFFIWRTDIAVDVLMPMLQVDGANVILATTLRDREQWTLPWMQNEKEKPVHILNLSEICDGCLKERPEEMLMCTHGANLQCSWINVEGRERWIRMMPHGVAMREMYRYVVVSFLPTKKNTHTLSWAAVAVLSQLRQGRYGLTRSSRGD